MESLVLLVALMALVITLIIMGGCALLWAAVLRRKFPQLSARWWLVWIPLLFGLSFMLALVLLNVMVYFNG